MSEASARAASRPPIPWTAPVGIAAALAGLAGVGLIVLGGKLLVSDSGLPGAFKVALVLIGALQIVCGVAARKRARVGWAFGVSINATAFVVLLFGAPKVRDAAEIGLALALAPALVFAAITALYALSADEY